MRNGGEGREHDETVGEAYENYLGEHELPVFVADACKHDGQDIEKSSRVDELKLQQSERHIWALHVAVNACHLLYTCFASIDDGRGLTGISLHRRDGVFHHHGKWS